MTNTTTPVRVHADHAMAKHLGHWTAANRFEVRARRGAAVLDLRSPDIAKGDIEIHLDIDKGMVKLLVPADARVDSWDLEWSGRGRVKDWQRTDDKDGRRIRLVGRVRSGEIRIQRGGIAILSAMFSRAYVDDVKRAHRDGGNPTVADPAGTY